MASEPLPPTLCVDRFEPLGHELLTLLRSLDRADWERPTSAGSWRVRDVAAHLLDTACRRVSLERDGVGLPPPEAPLSSDADLVAYLNRRNAEWVEACRRLSPAFLTTWMSDVEPRLAAVLRSLDPWSPARYGVSWAGEETSLNWFDTARELTERWHHQEQIRIAVEAPSLDDPFYVGPVMDAFLRALPFRYRAVEASEGTRIGLHLRGRDELRYVLLRAPAGWELRRGSEDRFDASLVTTTAVAWRSLTRGLHPNDARAQSQVSGRAALLEPFFGALAIVG